MRSFTRAWRVLALFCVFCCSSLVSASELSDGMQLFFSGQVQQSHQQLSAMIEQGQRDARVFYFRGLASSRLGDQQAAAADFRMAANLEMTGSSYGIGQALQRVQGAERVVLEKYRTMARLAHRRRQQQVAPQPRTDSRIALATQPTDASLPLHTAGMAPRFRLGSEIPIQEQFNDPYANEPASKMLTGEHPPTGPVVPSAEDDTPVGTGIVQASGTSAANPFVDDPSDEVLGELAEPNSANATSNTSRSGAGLLGAFRAIGNAVVPQVDTSKLVPAALSGFGGDSAEPGDAFPAGDDDPFGSAEDDSSVFGDDENVFGE